MAATFCSNVGRYHHPLQHFDPIKVWYAPGLLRSPGAISLLLLNYTTKAEAICLKDLDKKTNLANIIYEHPTSEVSRVHTKPLWGQNFAEGR